MTEEQNEDREQVRQLDLSLIQAFLSRDVESLDRILADSFTFTDPHGPPVTKAAWLEDLKSGDLFFESIDVKEIEVKIFGETAVAYGSVVMNASSTGAVYLGPYHYTDVYVKQDGAWRAILSTARSGARVSQGNIASE
jgi:ketosteroid isomerase-like protein